MSVKTTKLSEHVGVAVEGVSIGDLLDTTIGAELDELLGVHGVLVFKEMPVDDDLQVAFSRHFGEVQKLPGGKDPNPEIMVVSLDPAKAPNAAYLAGTFFWHIDGATDPVPNKCTMLSAKAVATEGGDTEFCNTYNAYAMLPESLKKRIEGLNVLHSFETAQLLHNPSPTEQELGWWRKKAPRAQPLAWHRRDGRTSIVLGATAKCIEGMTETASRELLAEVEECTIRPVNVYRHQWDVGDLVVWDNRGTMHRATPYATTSPRALHRTTILGDEALSSN